MKFHTPAGVLAIVIASLGTASEALTLKQAAQPAETPPSSYSKDVYVDSRGCVYVRASIGTSVNWVPRLSGDRKNVVCDATPTASVASVATPPPAPPAPPPPAAVLPVTNVAAPVPAGPVAPVAPKPVVPTAPVAVTPVVAPATAPIVQPSTGAIRRTMQVTCPADGSSARVKIGRDTVRVSCPPGMTTTSSQIVTHSDGSRSRLVVSPQPVGVYRVADVATGPAQGLPGGRVMIGGVPPGTPNYDFGSGYGITSGYPPLDPVPDPSTGMLIPPAGSYAPATSSGTVYVPAPKPQPVPSGYRPAWDDDRLNPYRGPRTAYGDAQMATVLDTTVVPMTAPKPAKARTTRTVVVTKSQPQAGVVSAPVATGARYVQVGAFGQAGNAQNALARIKSLGLGGATARTGSGLTLVMAGPFASHADLQRALSALRRYYPDAYPRG